MLTTYVRWAPRTLATQLIANLLPKGWGAHLRALQRWTLIAPLYPRPHHSADERADDRSHEGTSKATQMYSYSSM